MIDRHLMKLRARDELSHDEEQAIRSAVSETRQYSADHVFVRAGEELNTSTLVLSGLMCRFKDFRDGRRQIMELHVAGDFADLHSFTLKRLDHNVMTLTPCEVAIIPHENLQRITEHHPHLTRIYWFSTSLDAAIHREWVVSLGVRTALARVAALFCELHIRLGIVGLADGDSYELPLTQPELGECVGISAVHVNRTLRELRERGLVDFRGKRVNILDLPALRAAAEFDPGYLHLERRSR